MNIELIVETRYEMTLKVSDAIQAFAGILYVNYQTEGAPIFVSISSVFLTQLCAQIEALNGVESVRALN
ncbi:hypothetical protein KKE34_04315 [Patescibacteria group bacterium]|nr:hypothetical protein [Patescibacteria group bacterium]MBU1885803.1 hypothetical protein [Patescibacteria group bacterium]